MAKGRIFTFRSFLTGYKDNPSSLAAPSVIASLREEAGAACVAAHRSAMRVLYIRKEAFGALYIWKGFSTRPGRGSPLELVALFRRSHYIPYGV